MSKLWWAGIAVCIAIIGAVYYRSRGNANLTAVMAIDAATADRIVIVPASFGDVKIEPFEIKGSAKVSEFMRRLQFERCGGYCKCEGDFTYSFYRGEQEQLKISHHHGSHLRGPWEGDAYLTSASQHELARWLDAQGFAYLKERLEQ